MVAYWFLITTVLLLAGGVIASYVYFVLPRISQKSRIVNVPERWDSWWKDGEEIGTHRRLSLTMLQVAIADEMRKPQHERTELEPLIALARTAPKIHNPVIAPNLASVKPSTNSLSVMFSVVGFTILLLTNLTPSLIVALGVAILAGALPNQLYRMFWGFVEVAFRKVKRNHILYGISAIVWGAFWGSVVGGLIVFGFNAPPVWVLISVATVGAYFCFVVIMGRSRQRDLYVYCSFDDTLSKYDNKFLKETGGAENNET